jgi:D-serine dehydratase
VLERLLVATHVLAERPDVHASETEPFMVSAGGSAFFDRVVAVLEGQLPAGCRLVLRPGTYVTHDVGMYDALSPVGDGPARRLPGEQLRSALTLWAEVLSRPEPELAILNAGRRDSPADGDAPRARWLIPREATERGRLRQPEPLDSPATVFAANDQHMYLRIRADSPIQPGDIIGFGVSHPCLVMDRWRVVLLASPDGAILGGIRTFF